MPLLAQRPIARICPNSSVDSLPLYSIPSALKPILIKCNNQQNLRTTYERRTLISTWSLWVFNFKYQSKISRHYTKISLKWPMLWCWYKALWDTSKAKLLSRVKSQTSLPGLLNCNGATTEFQRLGPSSPNPFIFLGCKKKKNSMNMTCCSFCLFMHLFICLLKQVQLCTKLERWIVGWEKAAFLKVLELRKMGDVNAFLLPVLGEAQDRPDSKEKNLNSSSAAHQLRCQVSSNWNQRLGKS